jgi:Carbohydrate-binding module 48 (Isoamylase N-terminal domain)
MMDETRKDEAFAARVAAGMRDVPMADAGFVERVMATVATSAPARSWWLRPRTLRVTPLTTLALAAAVALVAFGLNTIGVRSSSERQPLAAASADTVILVRFVLNDDSARAVTLVGTFNDWAKGATPMSQSAPGVWTVTVPLQHGRHEYAFILRDARGERWTADPAALVRYDEFGTESSIVSVGS